VADVGEQIAVHGYEIRLLAHPDRARALFHAKRFRRRILERCEGTLPGSILCLCRWGRNS
jgi:hypothetical protein